MLLSPASCHDQLKSLLSNDSGPHTALLATPEGQLVCCASIERLDEPEDEASAEPWLDEPERIRLLLGLLSQWQQEESPRIECEVSRFNFLSHPDELARKTIRAQPLPSARRKHIRKRAHAAGAIAGHQSPGFARQWSCRNTVVSSRAKSESEVDPVTQNTDPLGGKILYLKSQTIVHALSF